MSSNENDELPGRLAELRKRGDGFRAPAPGYFEELAERSIRAGREPARTVGLNRKWLSMAAAIALLLVAVFLLWPNAGDNEQLAAETTTPASEDLLADIDASDIQAYIADNLDNFETELYAAEMPNFDPNE